MSKKITNDNKQVGKLVSELLKSNNINSYIICGILNLKPSNVSSLLAGEVNWKLEYIKKIAIYFKVSTDYLLFGDADFIKKQKKKSIYDFKQDIKDFLVREEKFKTYGELTASGFFDELKNKINHES